jgi:hypothetical protein
MTNFVFCLLIVVFTVQQGCDSRNISPSVRGGIKESYTQNIKAALLSPLDPSIQAPSDDDLNYAAERLPEDVKLEIVTDSYILAMEYPAFWDKTHPDNSPDASEWEAYRDLSNELKKSRAEQAARNYLGLMRH